MKKFTLFSVLMALLFLAPALSWGQDLIITGVMDGPLSGGTPKVVEVYVVNDIADLSSHVLKIQTNSNTSWSNPYTFEGAASAGDFIYITGNDQADEFATWFGNPPGITPIEASVAVANGDDRYGLFFADNLYDIYGVDGEDGTGKTWEFLDGWGYRNNGGAPTAFFDDMAWTYSGINALDNETTNATAATPFPIGTYVHSAATDPVITNITQTPDADITSATTVSVSADITSAAGVFGVELHWGTATGVLGNNINMSNTGGDTYTTDTDIPAQLDGVTVFYEVYAIDNNTDENTSAEQSYTVADPPTYDVTFNVDMNAVAGFNAATESVYISGTVCDWAEPGSSDDYKLLDGDGDLIYSLTLTLEEGDISYKYFKGAGWDGGEWSGDPNRAASITEITTLDDVFGQLPVTFNCDMSLAESFDPLSDDVYISGDFLGWAAPGTNAEYQLTDDDNDMIYSVTLNAPVADIAYKYFMNAGWDGGEWSGGDNRSTTITGITTLNDVFGFSGAVVLELPYEQDFESVTENADINLAGWTNANVEAGGVPKWIGKYYDPNKYAQMTSHNSTSSGADQVWLITPGLNMDATANEEFSFDVNVGYWKHAGLSVKISTDYDQTIAGIATATWTDVTANFTIPVIPTNGYGTFATAGTMDVSAYNGTMSIAFVYDGNKTDGETTTYQIDNVLVEEAAAPPATSTWEGTTNHDWATATNWDNGVPGATTDVIVPSGLTNYPTISAAASANTIAMAEGATLLGFENLTLAGNATFTQNHSGGTSGGGKDDDNAIYHMVSSPVVGASAISVFPSSSFVRSYDETTASWVNLTGTDVLAPGTGYSLWMPDGNETITYTGTLYTETISKTGLTSSGATPDPNYNGWHLLGNPFAAALQYGVGSWDISNLHDNVNVYNSTTGNYLTSDSDLPGNIIPVGQAFFVRASAADASINIPLDACVHSSTEVYKESRTNYFALNITNDANSYSDNTFVRFGQAYANEYETEDATKMYGLAAAPQIYTMEGAHKLKINSRRSAEDIALNLEAGIDATYTFTVSEFSIDGEVILEDKQTGHTEALAANSTYSFTASPEDPADRFVLHFNGMTDVEETALEGVQVYAANNAIYVNYNAPASAEISVYTVAGQKVMTATAAQGLNSLKVNNATGNYLVRIISAQGTMTEKVFVK